MPYSSSSVPLFADGSAGTLRLLFYLAASLTLMVADHRGDYLSQARGWAGTLVGPMYHAAAAPARLVRAVRESIASRDSLSTENRALHEQLLVANARLDRLDAVQLENQRLRTLLGGTRGMRLSVQLASLIDIDLDPFRHRILVDVGSRRGVRTGLAVIDGDGVVGQVIDASALHATVMLITDPSHAVPVQVVRSGVRTIAYGSGRIDSLNLPNIPLSADVRVGDQLVTSGLGGTFPAGFPVGRVRSLEPDETRLFVIAEAVPESALDRSGQVLLVWDTSDLHEAPAVGPPESLMSTPRASEPSP